MQENSSPKKALLGELESIIDILDDNVHISEDFFDMDKHSDQLLNIPMLNDVVDEETADDDDGDSLFDLDRIFSDEAFPAEPNTARSEMSPKITIPVNADSTDTLQSERQPELGSEIAPELAPQLTEATLQASMTAYLTPNTIYSKLENGDEEQSEMFPVSESKPQPQLTATSHSRQHNLNQDLDFLIQELVDELVPELENRLREQLSALSPGIIQDLAEKHLNQ